MLRSLVALLLLCSTAPAIAGLGEERRVPGLPGGTATPDSNMGFLVTITSGAQPGQGGPSLVALPLNLGTGDIADASAAVPCSEPGAPRTDGVVDALDVACELWESRQGGLWIWRRVDAAPGFEGRGVWRLPSGGVAHGGTWLDPVTSGEAIVVQALAPPGGAVANAARVAGSADDARPCPVVASSPAHPGLLNVFYHSMLRDADGLLCGLEGHDWTDADADGLPDACDAALFDPAAGGRTCVADVRDGVTITRCVVADPAGPHGLRFEGTNFALEPTRAAAVIHSPEQPAATWCQPHF